MKIGTTKYKYRSSRKSKRAAAPLAPGGVSSPALLASCVDSDASKSVSLIHTLNLTTSFNAMQEEISTSFVPKKEDSLALVPAYVQLGFSARAQRVLHCGDWLEWWLGPSAHKLGRANFCRDRLCPMCNWRRSLKIFAQLSRIMDVLDKQDFRYLFLTLTVKNCSADNLPATVDLLTAGWRRLYRNSCFRSIIHGSFRGLEVTRNIRTGEYHPHLHVVLAVSPSYFVGRGYISQEQWSQLWQDCCGLSYTPIVDIRCVTPTIFVDEDGNRTISYRSVVAEVSKYAVKSVDYLKGLPADRAPIVNTYLSALSGRRLVSMTGCFRVAAQQLKLDDVEDGDLVNVEPDQIREDLYLVRLVCRWNYGISNYQLTSVHRIGDDDD